jgi:hypothetical protein
MYRTLLAWIILFLVGQVAVAQCENQRCRGALHEPVVSGTNFCYVYTIGVVIHDGAPCQWNGTKCIGDPCPIEWTVSVTLNIVGGFCDGSDCVRRLKAVHTKCDVIVGLNQFTPSAATPTYQANGVDSLPCECSYEIALSLAVPVDPDDLCLGGFQVTNGATCSKCKTL